MYPPLAAQAAELGIVVASQPGFLSSLVTGSPRRSRTAATSCTPSPPGSRPASRSRDPPTRPSITADPRIGIRDASCAERATAACSAPAERLTAREHALALYTTQAAYACHREGEIGSLEPGKLADFVVLDQNPLETEPRADPGHRRSWPPSSAGPRSTNRGASSPIADAFAVRLPDFWKRREIRLQRTGYRAARVGFLSRYRP